MMVAIIVVLVGQRVSLTAGDEVPVHREGRHERHAQGQCQAPPEEEIPEPGIHRTGYDYHYQVVHDLHDSDRERVRGEGQGKTVVNARPDRKSGRIVSE
jgi:hypothetical protein